MVQLTLPKNSRMTTGKTWPKPEGATNLRKFSIYRWNPDEGKTRGWTRISLIWTHAVQWFWTR